MRVLALLTTLAFILPTSVALADDDDRESTSSDDAAAPTAGAGDEDAPAAPAKPKKKKKKKRKHEKPSSTDDGGGERESTEASSARATVIVEHDELPPRVTFVAELLGASPLDSSNRDLFGVGGGVSIGGEAFVTPRIGVDAGASGVYLAKDGSMSTTTWVAGHVGPRVHVADKLFGPLTHHDAWADAHVSYGTSGGIRRPGFDAGAAVQWEVSPGIRLGPMLRYQFGSDPLSNNAQLLTVGVAAGFGGRTRTTTHIFGDRDGDGVADSDDECPDRAAGSHAHAEHPGCPDQDADGVLDAEDKCPAEAAGDHPDPTRTGCPTTDRDGDKIADAEDRCPTQAGPPNPFEPAKHGCPTLAQIVDNRIEILQQIFFETDSATIKDESIPVLQAVADIMKGLDGARVRVEGHTDDRGSDEYNLDLSKRRARAVAQWLITNGGIDARLLETEGYGKSRPIVSGQNADVAQNRRVEFIILGTQ